MNAQAPEPPALTESERSAWRWDSEHGGPDFCHRHSVVANSRLIALLDAVDALAARDAAWAERLNAVEQERSEWREKALAAGRSYAIANSKMHTYANALEHAEADKARAVAEALEEADRRLSAHAGVDASCRKVVRALREEVGGRG